MRSTGRALALALGGAIVLAVSPVSAATCDGLWYQRNAIYKAAGYCFRTAKAIQVFGNAGCRYTSQGAVPLEPEERRAIAVILRQERAQGCS